MGKKNKETKQRDEQQFKKETKIGMICVGIAIVFIVLQLLFNLFSSKTEKKPTAGITTQTQSVRLVQANTSAALNAAEVATTVEDVNVQEKKSNFQIKKANKEVMDLLNINKKDLKKTIKDFISEYGYEYAYSAIYYGETIINHNDNTVTCSFVLDLGEQNVEDTLKFDLTYFRAEKRYVCTLW